MTLQFAPEGFDGAQSLQDLARRLAAPALGELFSLLCSSGMAQQDRVVVHLTGRQNETAGKGTARI
jgi:hypothetical protein